MRRYLVAGNWKMHGNAAKNQALLDGICAGSGGLDPAAVELLVCPPYPYLAAAAAQLSTTGVALGGQNVSEHEVGAFTGEVAPGMLLDVGCKYAIVGHSERRSLMGETDAQVAAKFVAAGAAGLVPILCVGELLQEREAGSTEAVIGRQLNAVIDTAGIEAFANAVVAYEPVWAIGTGKTATPEQAQDVHKYIRGLVAAEDAAVADELRILYGGSVKGSNAAGLFCMLDIDGGLIGGASLDASDFLAIGQAASEA